MPSQWRVGLEGFVVPQDLCCAGSGHRSLRAKSWYVDHGGQGLPLRVDFPYMINGMTNSINSIQLMAINRFPITISHA